MRDLRSMLRPRLTASLPTLASVAVLLTGSAFTAYRSHEAASLLANVVAKREHKEAEQARMARTVTRLSPDQERHWQALGTEIAYPWNTFFQAVERTGNVEIELLEMAPDKARRQMVLRGEARNSAALIVYVKALATQPHLRDVFVARIQNIERGDLLTVEFEIRIAVV